MKTYLYSFLLLFVLSPFAQAQYLTLPPDGGNKKASVGEQIGVTDIHITYNRPAVKGRDGKIWGQLVHYGFADLGFGTSKNAPWRAGANENTTIAFSTDVKIEGKELPAGKYGLFMAVQENEVLLIFSKNSVSWGSYFYDTAEDALRVVVKQLKNQPFTERLTYNFSDQTDNSAIISLLWERWRIPFKVEVDLHKTVFASMRNELRGDKGFYWQAFDQAATFCLKYNTNFEEGLKWSEKAIGETFLGEANFNTLSTKSQLLAKLGRNIEADNIMKEAIQKGSMMELHLYGRQLLGQKKTSEALEIFKLNATRYPNVFITNIGLARVNAALGDFKAALKYAKAAEPQAYTPQDKVSVASLMKGYGEGKVVN
jgi:tetratricopeptide (TPR) repeat protein